MPGQYALYNETRVNTFPLHTC